VAPPPRPDPSSPLPPLVPRIVPAPVASAPAASTAPPVAATRPALPVAPEQPAAAGRTATQAARERAGRGEETPLPFDAALGTILYGPDRRLAIVDGRIVQEGDEVKGARVVEITPTAVMLRDGQGRLRRITTGTSRR
jgi:hypothetical protein